MKLDNFGCVEINEWDINSIEFALHNNDSDSFVRVKCELKSCCDRVDVSVDNFPFNDTITYKEKLCVSVVGAVVESHEFDIQAGSQIKLTDNQINQINEFLEGVTV